MSTFDESAVRRQPEGVSTGGQFATKPRSESDVALAAPAAGAPATARVRRVADADLEPGTRVLVPGAGPGSAYFAATVKEVDLVMRRAGSTVHGGGSAVVAPVPVGGV